MGWRWGCCCLMVNGKKKRCGCLRAHRHPQSKRRGRRAHAAWGRPFLETEAARREPGEGCKGRFVSPKAGGQGGQQEAVARPVCQGVRGVGGAGACTCRPAGSYLDQTTRSCGGLPRRPFPIAARAPARASTAASRTQAFGSNIHRACSSRAASPSSAGAGGAAVSRPAQSPTAPSKHPTPLSPRRPGACAARGAPTPMGLNRIQASKRLGDVPAPGPSGGGWRAAYRRWLAAVRRGLCSTGTGGAGRRARGAGCCA